MARPAVEKISVAEKNQDLFNTTLSVEFWADARLASTGFTPGRSGQARLAKK
jgi:hypothetical protein